MVVAEPSGHRSSTTIWRKRTFSRQAASSGCRWEANHDNIPEALRLSMYAACRIWIRLLTHCNWRCYLANDELVAEKTFISFRSMAAAHPSVHFVAVSHSDADFTTRWIDSIGGAGPVHVIVDTEHELYAHWGLEVWYHCLLISY